MSGTEKPESDVLSPLTERMTYLERQVAALTTEPILTSNHMGQSLPKEDANGCDR